MPDPFQLPAWIDLGATFAIALTGSLAAIKRGYDIVGMGCDIKVRACRLYRFPS